MLLEPLFLEEAFAAVVDELPPEIARRQLDDDIQHIEPPATPVVVTYPITSVDELPPAGPSRSPEDVITFAPAVARTYATVVDDLPPARRPVGPVEWAFAPIVVRFNATVIDDVPPARLARELESPIVVTSPFAVTPGADVVDEVPPARRARELESPVVTLTPLSVVPYAEVVDEPSPRTGRAAPEYSAIVVAPLSAVPFAEVVDEAPPRSRADLEGSSVASPLSVAPFAEVVDDAAPASHPRELDAATVTTSPIVLLPFVAVLDELVAATPASGLESGLVVVEPPALIVPYFEALYPDIIPSAPFHPIDVIAHVEPPVVPPPPPKPRRRSAGFGPGSGGGGSWDGEVYRFRDDERKRKKEQPVTEELGDAESNAAGIAGMFGAGAAGFVGSKAITRAVERQFGKHAGAAAAVLSVVASAKAGDKLAAQSPRLKGLGTMVFGSVIAAVDDLVDIYVNERGTKPEVVQMKDAWSFIAKAQDTSSLLVTRRMGTRRSTHQRVLVLRYVSLQEKTQPPQMYVYQEVVPQAADGQFYIRGTLLELIRKAKRAT